MLSKCPINREMLMDVAAKLTEIAALNQAQQRAIRDGDTQSIEDLHRRVQAVFKAKERAVEAWAKHYREHGC